MEIRHLQTFITIAKLEGFTKAAEQLGYAQSTITAHIQILEEEIGKSLFDRLGKKVVLSSTGKRLMPYAKQMLELYGEIKNIVYEEEEIYGDLIIGVSESLTIYRLGEVLKVYKRQFPNVNLILKSAKCSELKSKLYSGEVDITLTVEPEIQEPDLVVKQLKDEKMMIIAAPEMDLSLFVKDSVESSKIKNSTIGDRGIILSEEGCQARISFEQYLKEKRIKYINPIELSSIEGIKNCVMNGLGISVVPYYTVENEAQLGRLKMLEATKPFPKFKTQMTYHKNKSISLALRKFMEIIEDEAKNW